MSATGRPDVFRVAGISPGTRREELRVALSVGFSEVERGIIKTEATIVPSCDSTDETKVALISFTPQVPAFLEPLMKDGLEDTQFVTKVGELNIDQHFFGLTQLYPTAQGEMILVDLVAMIASSGCFEAYAYGTTHSIVAVTGLDGHAYGSWRAKNGIGTMWLRHFLSTDFPDFRVMTYGYNSKLGSAGIHTLPDYDSGFLNDLAKARSTDKERNRPIIFICHSFGGLIVSKVDICTDINASEISNLQRMAARV